MTQSPNSPIPQDFVFGGIESDESRFLANECALVGAAYRPG